MPITLMNSRLRLLVCWTGSLNRLLDPKQRSQLTKSLRRLVNQSEKSHPGISSSGINAAATRHNISRTPYQNIGYISGTAEEIGFAPWGVTATNLAFTSPCAAGSSSHRPLCLWWLDTRGLFLALLLPLRLTGGSGVETRPKRTTHCRTRRPVEQLVLYTSNREQPTKKTWLISVSNTQYRYTNKQTEKITHKSQPQNITK